jgi:hypothetical protein
MWNMSDRDQPTVLRSETSCAGAAPRWDATETRETLFT